MAQHDFLSQPVSMGTTIMAASFDGGVVLGADSRTSTGTCERRCRIPPSVPDVAVFSLVRHAYRSPSRLCRQLPTASDAEWPNASSLCRCHNLLSSTCPADIANRATDKITPLTDSIYICRSGSAADTQNLSRYVQVDEGLALLAQ